MMANHLGLLFLFLGIISVHGRTLDSWISYEVSPIGREDIQEHFVEPAEQDVVVFLPVQQSMDSKVKTSDNIRHGIAKEETAQEATPEEHLLVILGEQDITAEKFEALKHSSDPLSVLFSPEEGNDGDEADEKGLRAEVRKEINPVSVENLPSVKVENMLAAGSEVTLSVETSQPESPEVPTLEKIADFEITKASDSVVVTAEPMVAPTVPTDTITVAESKVSNSSDTVQSPEAQIIEGSLSEVAKSVESFEAPLSDIAPAVPDEVLRVTKTNDVTLKNIAQAEPINTPLPAQSEPNPVFQEGEQENIGEKFEEVNIIRTIGDASKSEAIEPIMTIYGANKGEVIQPIDEIQENHRVVEVDDEAAALLTGDHLLSTSEEMKEFGSLQSPIVELLGIEDLEQLELLAQKFPEEFEKLLMAVDISDMSKDGARPTLLGNLAQQYGGGGPISTILSGGGIHDILQSLSDFGPNPAPAVYLSPGGFAPASPPVPNITPQLMEAPPEPPAVSGDSNDQSKAPSSSPSSEPSPPPSPSSAPSSSPSPSSAPSPPPSSNAAPAPPSTGSRPCVAPGRLCQTILAFQPCCSGKPCQPFSQSFLNAFALGNLGTCA